MDEVFLIGDERCPRCRGKDKGELLAGVINRLHQHLVKQKGVEMLLWSDRLLDASVFPYGTWEASKTGSHRAMERIPKDLILCDWHYERRADYPSVRFFQQQGFRVLPATWKNPDAAAALIRCAAPGCDGQDAGHPVHRLVGGRERRAPAGGLEGPECGRWAEARGTGGTAARDGGQIAATIKAALKELDAGKGDSSSRAARPQPKWVGTPSRPGQDRVPTVSG